MDKCVFVDESGDECLDLSLPTISKFYVVCAVVVDDADCARLRALCADVRRRYFKGREIKSASIDNDHLRSRILQELTGGPFQLHVLVVNKQLLSSVGFQSSNTFISYLHSVLYERITNDYPSVRVCADKVKNSAFMNRLRRYFDDKQYFSTLFNPSPFQFVDSVAEECVQLADFVAGTVRHCFEINERGAMRDPHIEQLKPKLLQLVPFPESYRRYIVKLPGFSEHDHAIEGRAIMDADRFLRANRNSDELPVRLQVHLLRKLVQAHLAASGTEGWVSTEELIKTVECLTDDDLNIQSFRGLVAALRDEGILIASRQGWGYKIATSYAEMCGYLARQRCQIIPMIERIRKARSVVLRATDNNVDILGDSQFADLKTLVEAMPHWAEPLLHGRELGAVDETDDYIAEEFKPDEQLKLDIAIPSPRPVADQPSPPPGLAISTLSTSSQ
jgi:hypothetical protein